MSGAYFFYGIKLPETKWHVSFLQDKITEEKEKGTDNDKDSFTVEYSPLNIIEYYEESVNNYATKNNKDKTECPDYSSLMKWKEILLKYDGKWDLVYKGLQDDPYDFDLGEYFVEDRSPKHEHGCIYFQIQSIVDRSTDMYNNYYGLLIGSVGYQEHPDTIKCDPTMSKEKKDNIDKIIMDKFGIQPDYYLAHETFWL